MKIKRLLKEEINIDSNVNGTVDKDEPSKHFNVISMLPFG